MNEGRIRNRQGETRAYQEDGRDGNGTNADRNTTKDFGSRHVLKDKPRFGSRSKAVAARTVCKKRTRAGFSWQIGLPVSVTKEG